MVYAPHLKVSFIGQFLAPGGKAVENFVTSIALASEPATALADQAIESHMDAVATASGNWWSDAHMHFPSTTVLTEVKIASIDTTGKYRADSVSHFRAINVAGHGSAGHLPLQTCFVLALRTGNRGASKRGRMYLPAIDDVLTSDGKWSASNVQDVESTTNAFMSTPGSGLLGALGVAQSPNGPGIILDQLHPVVASSKGYNTPISNYNADLYPGTQRRRRRSLQGID